MSRSFYEFFAGGGMASAGLGPSWSCVFANDIDAKKGQTYAKNWPSSHLVIDDINNIETTDLPGQADLAWASFPCQDLSLAGVYAGLNGSRSGTFWPFWRLMCALGDEGRGPRSIVLENVYGALRSHGGKDFRAIASAFAKASYSFGAMVIDARLWVPQSRPRLFFVGFRNDVSIPPAIINKGPSEWHPLALIDAYEGMTKESKLLWNWWAMPAPEKRNHDFIDLIEDSPTGCDWHTPEETRYILSLMSAVNRDKVEKAIQESSLSGKRIVGGVYRRTRDGQQRAEVRFDNVAGCLRTPSGGSSRQTILIIDKGKVRSRLLSPREAARLMGLDDEYILPPNYNQAYHVCGDGVAVPAVRHLSENLLLPAIEYSDPASTVAAE